MWDVWCVEVLVFGINVKDEFVTLTYINQW